MDPKTTQALQETLKDLTKNAEKSMIEFGKQAEISGQKLAETMSKQPPLGSSFSRFAKDLPQTKPKETIKSKAKKFICNLFKF